MPTNPSAFAQLSGLTTRRRGLAALLALPLSAVVLAVAGPAQAQRASGTVVTEERSVDAFEAIAVAGSIDVVVRQGPVHEVVVEVNENLADRLETVVESGRQGPVLQIRWQRGTRTSGRVTARVTVTTPTLRSVASAGSGDVTLERFQSETLSLSIAGSGDMRFDDFSGNELSLRIAGSGDIRGGGRVQALALRIAGSGDARLADLAADEVTISIAGSGDALVNAARTLKVSVAGSGDVRYLGNPEVSSSIAGSGSVRRQN